MQNWQQKKARKGEKKKIRWPNKTANHSPQLALISPSWVCFILTHKQSRAQRRWRAETWMKDACWSSGRCWDLCSVSDRKPHLFCLGNFPPDPLWIHVVLLDLRLPPKQLRDWPWHSERVARSKECSAAFVTVKGWDCTGVFRFACQLNIGEGKGDLMLIPVTVQSLCRRQLKHKLLHWHYRFISHLIYVCQSKFWIVCDADVRIVLALAPSAVSMLTPTATAECILLAWGKSEFIISSGDYCYHHCCVKMSQLRSPQNCFSWIPDDCWTESSCCILSSTSRVFVTLPVSFALAVTDGILWLTATDSRKSGSKAMWAKVAKIELHHHGPA